MSPAWVALGANLGDPRAMLRRALRWLDALPHTRIQATSSLHRTAPVGPAQPDYLNAVVRLETRLSPIELLMALQTLERAAGRQRSVHWGPRTLDLDLLLMGRDGRTVVTHPLLTLPHPRLHERAFVLAPLADIDHDLRLMDGSRRPGGLPSDGPRRPGGLPSDGLTVRARLATLSGSG